MTNGDIIKKLLKDIIWRVFPDNEDDRNPLLTTIEESISDAIDDIKEPEIFPQLKRVHKNVIDAIEFYLTIPDYMEQAMAPLPHYFLYSVADAEDKTYLLKIVTKESPYVITCSSFRDNDDKVVYLKDSTTVWDAVLRLWQTIEPNSDDAKDFWTQLSDKHLENYYLAIDDKAEKFDKQSDAWRYFAFTYFYIINEDRFPLPKDLEVEASKFKEHLTMAENAKYEQFFDTFNVLNEVKHSTDKLGKYLKVYHVVEQFAYREKFLKLINDKKDKDCSLVRRIEALTDTFKQSETSVIVSSVQKLYPQLAAALNAQIGSATDVLTPACRTFLQQKYEISPEDDGTFSADSVGSIVYNFRNSIVHNKETEFHFTLNNVSEYKDIIGLLDFITNHLIDGIIQLIEKDRLNPLVYRKKTLKLY